MTKGHVASFKTNAFFSSLFESSGTAIACFRSFSAESHLWISKQDYYYYFFFFWSHNELTV